MLFSCRIISLQPFFTNKTTSISEYSANWSGHTHSLPCNTVPHKLSLLSENIDTPKPSDQYSWKKCSLNNFPSPSTHTVSARANRSIKGAVFTDSLSAARISDFLFWMALCHRIGGISSNLLAQLHVLHKVSIVSSLNPATTFWNSLPLCISSQVCLTRLPIWCFRP